MTIEIQKELACAPDNELDPQLKKLVEKWDSPATALQILEVLDIAIHASLASGFVIRLLQVLYDARCKSENTTHEEVEKLATWRAELG